MTTQYPYTQPEYDAFGWSTLSRSTFDPAETYGLDYESARNATPRWFAVSFGNGNNGVSHGWPNYYCRCTSEQAFDLATAAMLSEFKEGAGQAWAAENCEVDGEADYTITAMILDPPADDDDSDDSDDDESWSSFNGAWMLCEVYDASEAYNVPDDIASPTDGTVTGQFDMPAYNSLDECFTAELLALARSV